MIIYAWKFTTYDDPADRSMADYLQFSVQRNDVDQFCQFLIENEKELHLSTTSIPNGSPHDLDSEKDVISDPREEFQKITIHKNTPNKYPIVVMIMADTMNISLTDEGRNLFIASLQKSKTFGYFSDNQLGILFKDGSHDGRDSKLIVWAANENGIIYY